MRERRGLTLAAMSLSSAATSIPTSAVVLAIPAIHNDFHASLAELQWTIVGFTLAYSALLIAAGRMSDVFGRRRFFLGGTVLYAGTAVAAAVAQDTVWLIVAIVGMGIGAAILTPASLAIITNAYPPERRATAIGIWAAMSAIVSGVGPAAGGILVDWNWRSVFWINVPFAVAFFVLALIGTRESKDPAAERRLDVGGLVALAGGLSTLSLALIQGQTWGWASVTTLTLFAVSAVLLAALGVLEPRLRYALLDFGFFRARNYLGGNVALLVVNFALGAVLFFLPIYLQEMLDYSPLDSGLLLLPLSGTLAVALPLGGPVSERVGPRIPIVGGLVVSAVGAYLLTRIDASSGYGATLPAMLLLGFGVGISLTPLNTAALNAVAEARHGAASGILITMSGLGATFGVALSGGIFQELRERRQDDLVNAAVGSPLSNAQERNLEGLLTSPPPKAALTELHKFGPDQQDAVRHAVRSGFAYGIQGAMWLSAIICIAAAFFIAVVMRREAGPVDEIELASAAEAG